MGIKKYVMTGTIVGMFVLFTVSMAFASSYTGLIKTIRINTGTGGSARVSIEVFGGTSCPTNGWYAYQSASTGVGLIRTHGLLAAYNAGRPIRIVGTGTCDAFSVERIGDVFDLLP